MLSWPGHVEAGAVSDYNGLVFDIFPTLIQIAGGAIAADLDAQSLVDILQDDAIETVRDLYFVRREGGFDYGGKSYQALIRGEWKLLQNNPLQSLGALQFKR
jgi:arylsulfatase A-like enzyme